MMGKDLIHTDKEQSVLLHTNLGIVICNYIILNNTYNKGSWLLKHLNYILHKYFVTLSISLLTVACTKRDIA